MNARLVQPAASLEDAFFEMADAVRGAEPDFASIAAVRREGWSAYLARLAGLRDGSVPSQSGVPVSTYWWVRDDGVMLGVSGLRWRLTSALRERGGHIGFAIRPSARRQGHGVGLLRATLAEAAQGGLNRVLLTCDADNAGSRGVIERCGGVLSDIGETGQPPSRVCRYWIAQSPLS